MCQKPDRKGGLQVAPWSQYHLRKRVGPTLTAELMN
jgi:hypothetical protein